MGKSLRTFALSGAGMVTSFLSILTPVSACMGTEQTKLELSTAWESTTTKTAWSQEESQDKLFASTLYELIARIKISN